VIDIVVPMEQEGTRAVVRSWLKKVGDTVAKDDPIVELETDKVAMEVAAPADGTLAEILLESDAEAAPGAVLGRIAPEGSEVADAPKPLIRPERSRAPAEEGPRIRPAVARGTEEARETRLSPAVRRAVREHRLDPAAIEGTGRGGRITRADVDRAVAEGAKPVEGVLPVAGATLAAKVVPHDRMRLAIAETMARSLAEAPHVTAVFEADLSAIAAHRARHKDALAAATK
jgi:2-oxoglutarate dehydrogenase E2 component (dihydrolipoamide succinyltransferase)